MGTTTKQLRRVDGGISRRGEPALSEAAALGRAATPWRAVDAVNMESVNDLLATRNGCGPSYADTENLGVVLWISGWAPWDHGNGPWDDDWRYIIEIGTVKRGTGDGTFPTRRPRWDAASFRILVPANDILNVLPTAALNIQWTQYKTGRGGYKIQIKDFDTGATVYTEDDWSSEWANLPANTLALSKKYTIKVWAITSRNAKGKPTGWVSATNTRVFTTRLSTPTNLAPVGAISTLTPTFTCDAVAKAVRYKVKIYDAAGTTVLHTSLALLLPSYPLGGGVLTDYATKKWTFTAYPDTACTAAYGVESAQVSIYKIELDDTLADGTVGTAYTGTVAATGGTGPYTYAVTSGTLPAGLTLASNGAVTGTPTTAATSAFTVTATDANGDTGSRAYSVTVAEATELPEGCYSSSPCHLCENDWGEPGNTKRTPLRWRLTLSVSALGCYPVGSGRYATLGAAALSERLVQTGSCVWGPTTFRYHALWSVPQFFSDASCSLDPDGAHTIYAVPVLTRISDTQFQLVVYFEYDGGTGIPTLEALAIITINNCRSAMSGTTNLTGPGPTYPVVGTLSYSFTVC